MRLLYRTDGGRPALTDDLIDDIPDYAILSHTWGPGEITFQDIMNGTIIHNIAAIVLEKEKVLDSENISKPAYAPLPVDDRMPAHEKMSRLRLNREMQERAEVKFKNELQEMVALQRTRALQKKRALQKLRFCLDQAAADGLTYCWIDSCCIDKSNSVELDKAINSMFDWYQNAAKCYTYLTDVSTFAGDDQLWRTKFRNSIWFTRGWTLQELIAPRIVEFFSLEGKKLGDKKSLEKTIRGITGIPVAALRGNPLSDFSRRERRLWTLRRTTTIVEDEAYCLLGLYEVSMHLKYGEGLKSAMIRLETTIDTFQAYENGSGSAADRETVNTQTYRRHEEVAEDVCMEEIIQVLRDIVHKFYLFAAPKGSGHEVCKIVTKLDVEKFVLLQWAADVKIFEVHPDKRLQDRETRRLVKKILDDAFHLLSDSSELKDRHGVRLEHKWIKDLKVAAAQLRGMKVSTDKRSSDPLSGIPVDAQLVTSYEEPTMSDPCLERLGLHLERPQVLENRRQQHNDGIEDHWVIVNAPKFEVLIDKLATLLTRLRDKFSLSPVLGSSAELEAFKTSHLETIVEVATEYRKGIADTTKRIVRKRITQQLILDTLWFRAINERWDSITEAHERTFEWALTKTNFERPWDDLCQWLQEGTGIYWISGKAGSGKSTLMKYVYSSESTKSSLSQWAGEGITYSMANFFFWYLGTPEQKTQQGLARGLLYQVLSGQPELIAAALPAMWKEAWDTGTTPKLPSRSESTNAFKVVSNSYDATSSRLCIFIDGLDEYVGDYRDGIDFIKQLATCRQVKIIVSSRPIPECVAAFSHLPKLRLQDLTHNDILTYVEDTIGAYSDMESLKRLNAVKTRKLMDDIVDKASGVFLWVVLACRSLQSGFMHFDNFPELERRINDLPEELEGMFKHMLSRVARRDQHEAARVLRLCFAQQQAQTWAQVDSMHALGLALISDYHIQNPSVKVLSDADKRNLCVLIEGRLRSRCGGLVEMVKHDRPGGLPKFCFCSHEHDSYIDATVCFMHRTVFEFLCQEAAWELDCLQLGTNDSFDADTALSLSRLHLAMQSIHGSMPRESQAISCLQDGVQFGSKADHNMPTSKDHIFWQMKPMLDSLSSLDFTDMAFRNESPCLSSLANAHQHDYFGGYSHATLAIAAEAGAANYIRQHPSLKAVADECAAFCECLPLFFYTLGRGTLLAVDSVQSCFSTSRRRLLSDKVVKELVLAGCDPNSFASEADGIEMSSPWLLWLQVRVRQTYTALDEKLATLETLEVFLRAGVNPNSSSLPAPSSLEKWIKTDLWDVSIKDLASTMITLSRQAVTTDCRRKRRADRSIQEDGQSEAKRFCYC
ncbi:hypothetical protein E8E14_007820 [Neopestalotiopsis sp. 37M]|nr:hypothetical protein E8E14_007820 [Neopestalotiopsis sp. 37M]